MIKEVVEKIKAGYPALYVQTAEYARALGEIQKAVLEHGTSSLFLWQLGKGIGPVNKHGQLTKVSPDTDGPSSVLEFMESLEEKSIVMLPLMHHFLEDPGIQSKLLDITRKFKAT